MNTWILYTTPRRFCSPWIPVYTFSSIRYLESLCTDRATVLSKAGFFLIGIWVPVFLHRLRLLTFRDFFSKKIGPY